MSPRVIVFISIFAIGLFMVWVMTYNILKTWQFLLIGCGAGVFYAFAADYCAFQLGVETKEPLNEIDVEAKEIHESSNEIDEV